MPTKLSALAVLVAATSAGLALTYGLAAPIWADTGATPIALAALKASSIVALALIAVWTTGASPILAAPNKLLATGLLFGALGDALLAWGPKTFLYGAFAFLIGHLFYITLFLRAGIGIGAALKQQPRLISAIALVIAALVMTWLLTPRESAMFAPLGVYTGVLTLMTLCSFTLPAKRWLAMAGAVLFFISDGFVAWNMFHTDADPMLAYWRGFAGWIIYWAAQAAICFGALGLREHADTP